MKSEARAHFVHVTRKVKYGLEHNMYRVYMLRSIPNPDQTYVGFSEDLKVRIKAHNQGQSPHTAKYKPWDLITYHAFKERSKARAFEKYLKTHSGKVFANKRLW